MLYKILSEKLAHTFFLYYNSSGKILFPLLILKSILIVCVKKEVQISTLYLAGVHLRHPLGMKYTVVYLQCFSIHPFEDE